MNEGKLVIVIDKLTGGKQQAAQKAKGKSLITHFTYIYNLFVVLLIN